MNASGVVGVIPNQQGIEAHQGAIKKTCVPSFLAGTVGVVNELLPRLPKSDGENLRLTSAAHFCEGPIPPEIFVKAKRLVKTASNFKHIIEGRGRSKRLHSVVYGTSEHINDGGDRQLTNIFLKCLLSHSPGISLTVFLMPSSNLKSSHYAAWR